MKKSLSRYQINLGIGLVFSVVFLVFSVLALINPGQIYGTEIRMEAMMENFAGAMVSLVIVAFHRYLKMDVSTFLVVIWLVFTFMALCLGSSFQFYYIYDWWDTMLHTAAGFLQSITFYALFACILRKVNFKGKQALIVFMAFMASMACASLWEIVEFSGDTLFGANAQKTIPIIEGFSNRVSSFEPLKASTEGIGEFYRYPSGFRFALMDTMEDMVVCFFGSLAFLGFMLIRRAAGKKEVMPLFYPLEETRTATQGMNTLVQD